MKDASNAVPIERSSEQEGFSNRRLIRPSLSRPEHNHNHTPAPMERRDRPDRPDRSDRPERPPMGKKMPPPETTNAAFSCPSRSEEHTSELQSRGHLVC